MTGDHLKQNAGPAQIARARRFRKEMAPAEARLWQAIRGRKLNDLKFRRQFPVENFTADFACLEHALVIELDGASHEDSAVADAERTRIIEAKGFRVMRIPNEAVLDHLPGVLNDIWAACQPPASSPAPSPPGRGLG